MLKLERRSASTVNKPSSKPSPFSSLLSIKKRRMPSDTSVTDATSVPGDTGHPLMLERDTALLSGSLVDVTEQAVLSDIQPPQAFSPLEQPLSSDTQPPQAGSTTAHSARLDSQSTQTPSTTEHPLSPNIQTSGRLGEVQSRQTVGDSDAAGNTEQASLPPVQSHRTSGVIGATNPTAVRLARDPLGKRSHPGYTRMTVYVQKQTHDDFKLVADLAREEMSEIVEKLIGDYTKARKKDLVRTFAG